MANSAFLTITDQTTQHLRAEILRGRWASGMPGRHQLASELGVNDKTVEAALKQLEKAGLLIPQGAGRKRRINLPSGHASALQRIGIFVNEGVQDQKTELFIRLIHALDQAGHSVVYTPKSLTELKFDVKRVAAIVRQIEVDAWIICAGSREVLEWFASQPVPAFALFGHRVGIKIAAVSPNKPPAVGEAARTLAELGHRRIVLLCRKIRRLPQPGLSETVFLDTLRAHGCPVGAYNLPDWEETNEGFQQCLASLFSVTPPTALIVDEAPYFVAAMQFLLSRGLRVPGDVSMICTDDDPAFAHCHPPVACITWDSTPVIRRIVNWAASLNTGEPDVRQTLTKANFMHGSTIGPVP